MNLMVVSEEFVDWGSIQIILIRSIILYIFLYICTHTSVCFDPQHFSNYSESPAEAISVLCLYTQGGRPQLLLFGLPHFCLEIRSHRSSPFHLAHSLLQVCVHI